MKKYGVFLLVAIACMCLAFTVGIFVGRNLNPNRIQLWENPASESSSDATTSSDSPAGLLNINTATSSQLEQLPQIGSVLAQRIIDYREENGPFTSVNDLLNVEGIGASRLNILLQYIKVEDAQ